MCAAVWTSSPALAKPLKQELSLPPSRHGWGLGWASVGLGLGLSVSPLIGGVLVGALGWRGAFLYRVPVAAAFIVLAAWTAAPRAGGHGAWRMVVPSDILRRPVLHAGLLSFLANYAQFAVWLLVPFYLVGERGLSAAAGGLLFMLTPLVLVGGALALVGLGLGVFQVPNIAQAMAAFPPRQQGAAGGFAFLSRTAGVVVGVQAAAWLFHDRAEILGFSPAFRFTFAAAAAVCALAALLALLPGLARVPRATR